MDQIFSVLKSIIVFALLLGVLVVVHEFGHYTVAKLTRMRVHEFAFGFGPVLARLFKRGETQFSIRWIPLGGFVRIAGMEPGEEAEEGGFNSKPIWQRALVIFAGPFMSLFLGYIVLIGIGMVWGTYVNTTNVAEVVKGSPAAQAGIKKGDVILALDGKRLDNGYIARELLKGSGDGWLLRTVTSRNADKEMTLLVDRKGEKLRLHVTPKIDKNAQVARLGVGLSYKHIKPSFTQSIPVGTIEAYRFGHDTITTIFSKRVKNEVGGIVMIGYVTHGAVQQGPRLIFFVLALLSLTLGIMNLLPIPVLDGGHLLYLTIEKIRGKRLQPELWYKIQLAGMAALIMLAVFLVYFDIARIATGNLPGAK
ncbi:MAG TPA: M50 family metallopeptidase [Armatimonadota bacterium]|nr:M50 family metallopeptidase [Armatimonadota bacterium]